MRCCRLGSKSITFWLALHTRTIFTLISFAVVTQILVLFRCCSCSFVSSEGFVFEFQHKATRTMSLTLLFVLQTSIYIKHSSFHQECLFPNDSPKSISFSELCRIVIPRERNRFFLVQTVFVQIVNLVDILYLFKYLNLNFHQSRSDIMRFFNICFSHLLLLSS